MKKYIGIFYLPVLVVWATVLSGQNNDIFHGGIGSGHYTSTYVPTGIPPIYKGGIGGAIESTAYVQSSIQTPFSGSPGDGWQNQSYVPSYVFVNTKSGVGQGWTSKADVQTADTALFHSQSGDGWTFAGDLQQADTTLFYSQGGDGWVGLPYGQSADQLLFRGGEGDGWIAQPVDIPMTPLPLEFLSFTATSQVSVDELDWTTANEINTSHFVVEHSTDGMTFRELGMVNAAGNSADENDYSFTNKKPANGINYYRLKLIDLDASIKYSNIVSLFRWQENLAIEIFPNPAANVVNIRTTTLTAPTLLNVYNEVGGLMVSRQLLGTEEISRIEISNWPSGYYLFQFKHEDKTTLMKLVKSE